MAEKLIRKEIGKEAYFSMIRDPKFKSDRITLCMVTPLRKETVTANALVSFVLRKGCKSCPDFTLLNKKLADLYGAILDTDASKHGDLQIIKFTIQFLDDRYALGKEKMVETAAKLLADVAFDPNFDENGLFPELDVTLERSYLIDTINSDLNEKRTYAIGKALSLAFEGEPFGIKRYGTVEDAEKLTNADLVAAWKNLVRTSRFEMMFTGPGDPAVAEKVLSERISRLEREPAGIERAKIIAYTDYKEETESMDVVQGKLVMAFRLGAPTETRERNAARVFSALYGGTPFSKLFMNVREKRSLCYYVSSSYERSGILLVDSGIEFDKREATQKEIIRQLAAMQEGDFTEEELSEAKLLMKNSIGSVTDSLGATEGWYLGGILDDDAVSPEEDQKQIDEVTAEEVIALAKRAVLSTVFFLKGAEEE